MEQKLFTFSMSYEFLALNEQDAIKQFQEMLDDTDWNDSTTDAKNWKVEVEDVEVSELQEMPQ
jgi:hypothetical protein